MTFEWDKATARERDAWIAVRLFGWRWMLQHGAGGYPHAVALFPPESPGRTIFNLAVDAKDVTDEIMESWDRYERFSDWTQMCYRDGESLREPLHRFPHFTTDAAAEWEAVLAFRERHQKDSDTWDEFVYQVHRGFKCSPALGLYRFLRNYEPGLLCRAMWQALRETDDAA